MTAHANAHMAHKVWREAPGYEGLYEVSDLGRVRSLDRVVPSINRWGSISMRHLRGQMLRPTLPEPTPGYFRLEVKLSKDGQAPTRLVHHLVMETFVGPRPAGAEVAHGDGDSLNNRLSNLRYATPAENTADKILHGTVVRGSRVGGAKLSEEQVRSIKASKGSTTLRVLAVRYGVAESCISRIQNGVRWGHLA